MSSNSPRARLRRWFGALGALIVLVALLACVAALLVDAGYFRKPLLRYVAARTQRDVEVKGAFRPHLFSLRPSLSAEAVLLGNPRWTRPGSTAEIQKLQLTLEWPWLAIRGLDLQGANLTLNRDLRGHANWQWTDPDAPPGKSSEIIRSITMPNARVRLDDELRRLHFVGTADAQDASGSGSGPFRIAGSGQLNGRPATFKIDGDPLATASHEHPYHFLFDEHSSIGSRIAGSGSLQRPFDFSFLEARFDASGDDLKDLYYLTGVSLIDTGPFRLSGQFIRTDDHFQYRELRATSGDSDMRGSVALDSSKERPRLDAHLSSQRLRWSDLGAKAAGRGPPTPPKHWLPDNVWPVDFLRRRDATVDFDASRFEIGRIGLTSFTTRIGIERGKVTLNPLRAVISGGALAAHATYDASSENPLGRVDLKIEELHLGELHHGAGPPLIDGLLRARLQMAGRGRSVHELAAGANGTVAAVMPHGTVRAALAELAGTDLRGAGLLLARNSEQTELRCGLASFKAENGLLTMQDFTVDTAPVLITGSGSIDLNSEALDLEFVGKSKRLRLMRLHSPLAVQGTLLHPVIAIRAGKAAVQAGAAVALGVALTPLAALLAFVDPGLASDVNCAGLVEEHSATAPRGSDGRARHSN